MGIGVHRGAGKDRTEAAGMAQGLEETGTRPCTWVLPKKLVRELAQLTGIKEHQAVGEDFWLRDSAIAQLQDPSLGYVQCWLPHSGKDRSMDSHSLAWPSQCQHPSGVEEGWSAQSRLGLWWEYWWKGFLWRLRELGEPYPDSPPLSQKHNLPLPFPAKSRGNDAPAPGSPWQPAGATRRGCRI